MNDINVSNNKMNLSVDWKYLVAGKGLRKVENILQVVVGRILLWLVFIIEIGIIVSEFTKQHYLSRIIRAEGTSGLAFWLFACLFLYSLYLLRDRERFLDKARSKNLNTLRGDLLKGNQYPKIEVTDYFNHSTLWLFDYATNLSSSNYLEEFFKKLFKLPKAAEVIERLGLTASDLNLNQVAPSSIEARKAEVLKEIIVEGFSFSYQNGLKYVSEEAIAFVAIQKFFLNHLQQFNIISKDLEGIKLWLRNEATKRKYVEDWQSRVSIKPKTTVNRAYTSRFTPTLNEYARDFTNGVIQGDFRISRMVVEDVPPKLEDMRLVGFDFNKAFSASKNIESFKKKLRKIFDEVSQAKNVVLVLDNFNQLLNLRKELAGEVANIIIDSFDSSTLRMIATCDRSQFIRFIRPNRALAGLFSHVEMVIPSDEVATQIAIDEVPGIEKEYDVKIAFSAVKASIELSHKVSYDRVLPDKALQLLKETVVNFKGLAGKKPIEYDEVAKVVSSKVGVKLGSITEDESKKLAGLEERMHKRVIDQEESIKAVSGALRRSRSGLTQDGKPVASFLFFGPTGVGKTEVAKTVAEVYFGNEEKMVRVDMSEYHEEENLKRLIGFTSPQGSFEGGFLTEPVHQNPFSLVLLDEIDKANPKVLDLFLQVLDEGYLDDGLGRKVDFSNTIIITTSNAGSSVIAGLLEKGENYENVRIRAIEELKKVFKIEFLNRFDKIIMFKPLSRSDVKQVARKFVEQVRLKLLDKGITLEYDDILLERLAKLGYNPVFGAREMRRVVQEEVENKIAEMIVSGKVKAGGVVRL
jgi:ATP-dependent Clp protease ATP-binding subunit ClpC